MTIFEYINKLPPELSEYMKKFLLKNEEDRENMITGNIIKMAIELKKEQKDTINEQN